MSDQKPTRIVMDVDRDGWTNGLQLNIAELDENNSGWGYRLGGPKYNGSSKNLLRVELDERDAAEIRQKLDKVFPLDADGEVDQTGLLDVIEDGASDGH